MAGMNVMGRIIIARGLDQEDAVENDEKMPGRSGCMGSNPTCSNKGLKES